MDTTLLIGTVIVSPVILGAALIFVSEPRLRKLAELALSLGRQL